MVLCAYKTSFMDADKISEEVEMITEILDAFAEQEEELEMIQSVAMDLLDILEDDAPDSANIRNQVETLNTRFRVTRDHLEKRKAHLDKHNQHLVPFRYCTVDYIQSLLCFPRNTQEHVKITSARNLDVRRGLSCGTVLEKKSGRFFLRFYFIWPHITSNFGI